VTVLPEIGGKIWSAVEKSTGRSFIYENHVVKFRDIAMRGPWTSGGIEPNYGIIGHTPNCATPVDYVTAIDADGQRSAPVSSASFVIPSLGNPPDTTITSPLSKSVFHFPNNVRQVFTIPITGTAVDSGGSLPGIAQVRVSVKNIEHSEYYCGSGGCPGDPTHVWTTKFISIPAILASPGAVSTTWTSSFQTYDHPHNYAITAWAIDRNGERDPTNANVHPICVRDAKSGCYS
jgi:hypothetical protein